MPPSHFFRRLLPCLILLSCQSLARATDYFVSPSGNDSNSGTSQAQAWQTIDRVSQIIYSLQPGDRIRFQRGGVYRGELTIGSSGTSSQPIVVGAYGSGADPVISGSVAVTGWTNHQGNIWKAPIAQAVEYVFVNGQRMTLARYPNSGWLRNDNGSGTTLHDAALTQPNGYWTGATAVIRSTNWSYDAPVITGFSGGTLSFSNIWYNLDSYEWGYFLCDKLSELDAPGEWYHDPNTGMLYLWTLDGGNPTGMLVEAAVKDRGVICGWQKQWITIDGIAFRHQKMAAVRNDGANHVTVTGCTFQDCFQGINSYGDHSTYAGNTFNGTYATAMHLIDDNTTVSDNILTNIAMVPGLGESNWGYFGIRLNGTGNIIRSNRLTTIGYIGIAAGSDCLVEKNVVDDATALLNDGGGISFDGCNGMIVRDNIVLNVQGDLESSAPDFPNYEPIAHGIYFGNTVIQNTLVQHNTVAHCTGSGIHVDHTMVSSGNQIKDNVLFNNKIQLSVSDFSNNNGPGATAPYHVPSFNGVYSGNVFYCLTKDQLCMKHFNVYSANPVDFGTFDDNRYFNPYEELSIHVHNTYNGAQQRFTLERWQAERGEDPNSTRSPLHLNAEEVIAELGGELIVNGEFDYNVTGWDGWPTNAEVTHDYTYLDNGALKAHLPNANQYPEFGLRNPDQFTMQDGQWYRMRFSLQSSGMGEVRAGVKGMTQMTGQGMIAYRDYPFSGERRDVEFVFQGDLDDQALLQFTHHYSTPTYWLDNVSLKRVQVAAADPFDLQVLLVNDQPNAQTFTLAGCWSDVDGQMHSGSIPLPAYRSIVLVKEDDAECGMTTGVEEGAPSMAATMPYPNPARSGDVLNLSWGCACPVDARLLDPSGRTVHRIQLDGGSGTFPLPASIAPGKYVMELAGEGAFKRMPLIVL